MKKVMIDPGHGPGSKNKGPSGYYEHEGMWRLSNFLKAALERCGVTAALTRKENEDPGLQARGAAARGYDLFISEHSNAFSDGSVRGCEVFYSVRQTGNRNNAAAISAASAKLMRNPDRGAKTKPGSNGDWFGVIRAAVSAGCPHVYLAESGFHSNRQDEAWLMRDVNLRELAEVHAGVICRILGVDYAAPGEGGGGDDGVAGDGVFYRVQVGAFADRGNAEALMRKLKSQGYDTYMVMDEGLYKVQAGAFAEKGNAEALGEKLKKDGWAFYISTRAGTPVTGMSSSSPSPTPAIRVGSKVRVRRGAKDYNGNGLASFVYRKVYEVLLVSGDRVVIGERGKVTAAVNIKDLY